MDIRTVLTNLTAIQGGLSITDPITDSIAKAYKYFPPESAAAPTTPCFMNDYTLVGEERDGGLRKQDYTVHMQLLVFDADQDRAADIASAYLVKLIAALDADTQLTGDAVPHVAAPACSMQTLRGGNPTLAVLTRANRSYIGLDLYLDVVLKDAVTFN